MDASLLDELWDYTVYKRWLTLLAEVENTKQWSGKGDIETVRWQSSFIQMNLAFYTW
jgi:hypothetical protein